MCFPIAIILSTSLNYQGGSKWIGDVTGELQLTFRICDTQNHGPETYAVVNDTLAVL